MASLLIPPPSSAGAEEPQASTPGSTTAAMCCTVLYNSRGMRRPREAQTVRLSVTVPRDHAQELERIAATKHVSVSWVVADAVRRYLEDEAPLLHYADEAHRVE